MLVRAAAPELLGPRSLSPFDGERAEKRCDVVSFDPVAGALMEATEPVEDFRRPMKETESRLLLRKKLPVDATTDCRGTRDVEVDGDPRVDVCFPPIAVVLGVAPSSLSITPNSLVERAIGEGLVEDGASPVMLTLVRRLPSADVECFKGGDGTAEVRLEIRGILVGVSLGRPEAELFKDEGGSFAEFAVPLTPTDGEPAIVGS